MHVLQICHSYYPPFLDCARQYAALFKDTQYQVTTVYLQGEFSQAVVDGSASDEVIFLGFKSSQIGGLKLGAIAKIKNIVAKTKFEFCIAHRVKPTYVALLATNLPVISVHHNYNDYSKWSRRLLVNFYQKRLLMLGVSNSVRDDLQRDLQGWPAERIQTLYNRIDVDRVQSKLLDRKAARQALGIAQQAWVVGTAGRLHHDKDYPTLLRGFAQALPNMPTNSQLVILGKGPLEAELKALSVQLGIANRTQFLGFVPDGAQYFKAFDVFALTSNHEPFGMVLLEAMAAEVPIICSDCGGGAEVVRGAGLLFELKNVSDFAKQLQIVAQAGADQYVQAGRDKLSQNFSDQAAQLRFQQIIKQTLSI